jgi:dihydropteroate synthase
MFLLRLAGTLAATAIAAWQGASVFRAHQVRPTRRVVEMAAITSSLPDNAGGPPRSFDELKAVRGYAP